MKVHCKKYGQCVIDKKSRISCKFCRLQKCFDIGMEAKWVMTENDKKEKEEIIHRKKQFQKEQHHSKLLFTSYEIKMRYLLYFNHSKNRILS